MYAILPVQSSKCYNVKARVCDQKDGFFMATIEERLTAPENQHAELREKMELQTIAIGALVNKATLERLNEKYDKLFDVLITHDRLTNEQLAELRTQQLKLDSKLVGVQTEMRQGFEAMNARFEGLEQSMNSRLEAQEQSMNSRLEAHDARFDRLENMLSQILIRLQEK